MSTRIRVGVRQLDDGQWWVEVTSRPSWGDPITHGPYGTIEDAVHVAKQLSEEIKAHGGKSVGPSA